jgi:hypothetical protein
VHVGPVNCTLATVLMPWNPGVGDAGASTSALVSRDRTAVWSRFPSTARPACRRWECRGCRVRLPDEPRADTARMGSADTAHTQKMSRSRASRARRAGLGDHPPSAHRIPRDRLNRWIGSRHVGSSVDAVGCFLHDCPRRPAALEAILGSNARRRPCALRVRAGQWPRNEGSTHGHAQRRRSARRLSRPAQAPLMSRPTVLGDNSPL